MLGADILKSLNYQDIQFKHGTYGEQVYFGTYSNFPVTLKVIPLPLDTNYEVLEKEFRILINTSHKNIVKVYSYQWVEWYAVWYLVVTTEACEKDLANDTKQRRDNAYPYSEENLWDMLVTLVRAFAYMQRQGLAHRDIKPQSIFLSRREIKIGDFGAARYLQTDQMAATVAGTPIYLSPLLLQGLISRQQQVVHNVYKSDVYSLGLTLLELANLQQHLPMAWGEELQIRSLVMSLHYSLEMKKTLLWMLMWDEQCRPDFVQLDEWITATYYSPPPAIPVNESQFRTYGGIATTGAMEYKRQLSLGIDPINPIETPAKPVPPETDTTHPEEKKYKKLQCLFCKNLVQMKPGSPVVQLKCSPDSHVYCSPKCLSADISKQQKEGKQPVCSTCKTPIDDDDLAFYGVEKAGVSMFSYITRWFVRFI